MDRSEQLALDIAAANAMNAPFNLAKCCDCSRIISARMQRDASSQSECFGSLVQRPFEPLRFGRVATF